MRWLLEWCVPARCLRWHHLTADPLTNTPAHVEDDDLVRQGRGGDYDGVAALIGATDPDQVCDALYAAVCGFINGG